jgi:choice-of-anchor A domain-containing protein
MNQTAIVSRCRARKGGALIGALGVSLILTLLVAGTITLASSYRNMAKVRGDSEAALLLAEAGVNDELNRIALRMKSYPANQWSSSPDLLPGEPYRGRKGTVPDVPGTFWVYSSTGETNTTAWPGTGPIYVTATAVVGRSMRRVSVEAGVTTGQNPKLFDQFNAFFRTNASTGGGHSEGPVAGGGNFQGSYEINQHGHKATVRGETNIGLYVNGNSTSNGHVKKVFGGTNAHVSGNVSSQLQMLGGGQIKTNVDPSWFVEQYNLAKQVSAAIRNANKEPLPNTANNVTIDTRCNTLNGKFKIYSVDNSQIKQLKTFNVNGMSANETLIIDVTGTSIDWGWQVNAPYPNRIIWNFKDAVSMKVKDRNLTGVLLAPDTNLIQQNNIQGAVFADKWTVQGAPELHWTNFKFAGDLFGVESAPGGAIYKGNYQLR